MGIEQSPVGSWRICVFAKSGFIKTHINMGRYGKLGFFLISEIGFLTLTCHICLEWNKKSEIRRYHIGLSEPSIKRPSNVYTSVDGQEKSKNDRKKM